MSGLEMNHQHGEELEKRLKLLTLPLAVKLLKSVSDIPANAKKPREDLGHRLSLCQAFALSRRNGMTIASIKEDNWCFYPVIALGLEEPPAYFLEGKSAIPGVRTPEGNRNWCRAYPRLPAKQYIGIVSAPLKIATFEPDLVLIYGDSMRLINILLAVSYKEGHEIASRINSGAACGYYIVPPMQTGEYQLSVPCHGDRRSAIAQDDELVFSVPIAKLEELTTGIRKLDEDGRIFPRPISMEYEYESPPCYKETARILGIPQDRSKV